MNTESSANMLPTTSLPSSRRDNHAFRGLVFPFIIILTLLYFINTTIIQTRPTADVSDPKDTHVKTGILTVTSVYKRPVIIATIRGYLNEDGCTSLRQDGNNTSAVATVTILSEMYDPILTGTFYQYGVAKRRLGMKLLNWETNFHLNIGPPPSFEQGDLCFGVFWRVEYVDFQHSMSNFPTSTNSFRGKPTFHRVWNWTDFNHNVDTDANWLVRKSHEEKWSWSGHYHGNILKDGKRLCPVSSLQEDKEYSIVMIGDSQPSYMCQHLIWELQSSKNVRCVQIKQTLQNETTFLAYANELQNATEDVVIFNPSGLWEAAYGSIELFRDNFERLLQYVPSKRSHHQSYFFAPTTAVQPIVYENLASDKKKWSMTQVRVREINTIAKQLVVEEGMKRIGDSISLRVLPTPIDALSLNCEDDPKSPTDMRHFGNRTNEMLLDAILCDLD